MSTNLDVLASQADAILILGPPLIGWSFNLLFYGIGLAHTFKYMGSALYRSDSTRLNLLLVAVFTLASLQSGLTL